MKRSIDKFETYREIKNQGRALQQLLQSLSAYPSAVERANHYLFTGCGSSYFLAQLIAQAWAKHGRQTASAFPASEILLHPEVYFKREGKTQLFAFSRSGNTTETVRAVKQANRNSEWTTVAVTCQDGCDLQECAGRSLIFPEIQEKSVVMTQAFTGMLGAFLTLCGLGAEVAAAATLIEGSLDRNEERVADLAGREFQNLIFLGTGPFLPLARESMLKVKEMTALPAEAWQSFEFRHGFQAAVDSGSLIWLFVSREDLPYLDPLIDEVLDLNATLCLTGAGLPKTLKDRAHVTFDLCESGFSSDVAALASIHLAQLYAFFKAVGLGRNPDSPPKLTRVVKLG